MSASNYSGHRKRYIIRLLQQPRLVAEVLKSLKICPLLKLNQTFITKTSAMGCNADYIFGCRKIPLMTQSGNLTVVRLEDHVETKTKNHYPFLVILMFRPFAFTVIFTFLLFIPSLSDAKEITVVASGTFPPFTTIHEGKLGGYAIEIANELIQRTGHTVNKRILSSKRIRNIANTPDLIQPALARTPSRESSYSWIGPIYPRVFSVYSLTASAAVRPTNLQEATKFSIAELWDSSGYKRMKEIGFKQVHGFKSFQGAMRRFLDGGVDLIRLLEAELCYFSRELAFDPLSITELFSEDTGWHYYIALHRDSDPELVEGLSTAFEEMKTDGSLEKLQKKFTNCSVNM